MTQFIITPAEFKLPPLKKNLLFFFSLNHFYRYRELTGFSKVKSYGPVKRFEPAGFPDTSVLGGCIGASFAALMLENAIYSGAENIVTFGSCGYCGLNNVSFGTLTGSSRALDSTGISADYGENAENVKLIPYEADYSAQGLVSINSLFTVSKEKILFWRRKEIEIMDMEVAALSSIASYRNVKLSHLLVVSDRINENFEWVQGFSTKEFKDGIEQGLQKLLLWK